MSRQLSGRAVRFAATGVGVTAIHASVAVVLIERFLTDVVLANGLAFAVATTVSFMVNTLWSFQARLEGGRFVRFICVSLVGLALSMTIAWAAEQLGLHYLLGILCIIAAVPVATFLLHNFWTYAGQDASDDRH